MFRQPNEVYDDTCSSELKDQVNISAGSARAQCLGTGLLEVADIELKSIAHVDKLKGPLIHGGKYVDEQKVIVFRKDEAKILNMKTFSVSMEGIV